MADDEVQRAEKMPVRVDPETGVLYVETIRHTVDPVEVVLAFLGDVNPAVLEDRAIGNHGRLSTGESFIEALKDMARGGG